MSEQQLLAEVEELRQRLEEAESTLLAIRSGQVDALIVSGAAGEQVFVLKGAEQPYRIFLETMNEGAVTLTADGNIAYSNLRFAEILKTALEQVIGAKIEGFVEPGYNHPFRTLLDEARSGNAHGEIPFSTADGTVEWTELFLSPTKLGEAPGICLVANPITERRRVEEQHVRLAAIVESSGDAIIGKNLDGVIVSWNAAAEKLFGYSAAEAVGLSVSGFLPAGAPNEYPDLLDRIRGGALVHHYESERVHKSGRSIQVSLGVSPIRDLDGQLMGASTIARDITQRKRTEQALLKTAAELREAHRVARLCTWSMDVRTGDVSTGEITTEELHRLVGRNPTLENPPYSEQEQIFKPQNWSRMTVALANTARTGEPHELELEIVCANGSEGWILARGEAVRDANGTITGLRGIAQDITERKQAEVARHESETAFRTLTDAMPQFVWMCTPGGLCVYFSQQWVDYTGLTLEQSYGTGWNAPFHPDDKQNAWNAWDHATKTGEMYYVESRLRAADGRYRWFLVRGVPSCDAGGHIVKWFGTCTDIDEKRRLEDQLRGQNLTLEAQNRQIEDASRLKSAFLANMSHELRSPLNGIIGFTELLYDGKLGVVPERPREFLARIHKSAKHLLQLINGVLDLSKIEAGRLDLRLARVRLPDLVQDVAGILGAMAVEKGIRIKTDFHPGVDRVITDPGRFKQILHNYLSNALKFTAEGGKVTIRLKPEGAAEFRLEVSDTGVGIEEKDIPRLFTEFQQLDSTASKRYQGTGLGLALTKRLVEAQGGRVGVCSRPGKGSTFYAVLSRETSASALPTILVVEDEKAQSFVLTKMLQSHGYAVETATTCAAAVAKCRERPFDAITLDLVLPDGLGYQALASIRSMKEHRDTPIIVVTMMPDRESALSHDVQGFLSKPVDANTLLALLEHCGVGIKTAGVV